VIGNKLHGNLRWLAAIAFLAPSVARADGDAALAQSLFDEALRLMDQNRYSEACPKLAESQRLDPGGGTLHNLGLCREKEGKLATAWAVWNEALSRAIKDQRKDRENTARQHVDALAPQVAKIVINVPESVATLEGLEITLDGARIGRAAWGLQSPVDVGTHPITAMAMGKQEWQKAIEVRENGEAITVDVPDLVDAPKTRQVEKPLVTKSSPLRPIGLVVGGVGVAGVIVGAIGGGLAIAKRSDSNAQCPMNQCTQKGVSLNDDAKAFAWVANIGFGVGIAGLAVGTLLFIMGKPTQQRAAMIVPSLSDRTGGAAFTTTF